MATTSCTPRNSWSGLNECCNPTRRYVAAETAPFEPHAGVVKDLPFVVDDRRPSAIVRRHVGLGMQPVGVGLRVMIARKLCRPPPVHAPSSTL